MASSGTLVGSQGTKISLHGFLAVLWTFTALSLTFLLFRLHVRLSTYRRLLLDDLLVALSWIIMLATTVMWQIEAPGLYRYSGVFSGKDPITIDFVNFYSGLEKYMAPFLILFYTGIWLVKFSFLAFFYNLGARLRAHRAWWWVVFAITLTWWFICIGIIDYDCTAKGVAYAAAHCDTVARRNYDNRIIYTSCAGDIMTDLLILSVPACILWNSQMPLNKKLVLLGFFFVTVAIMVVAILRVLLSCSDGESMDISWFYFWTAVEIGTAIMVACIASFRQFYVTSRNKHLFGKESGGSGSSGASPEHSGSGRSGRFLLPNSVQSSGGRESTRDDGPWSMERVLLEKSVHDGGGGGGVELVDIPGLGGR
ncbi:hypothetical protein BO71DRAFT_355514 [Aspergillus ellipticus CBS 707.79]|uniref:Rhodopsin domain-containing protein n=1 Tax=Aspergillus ellipticus CBS 707.79 TaxID=1448320 RepID=A0A319D784_9EURO|nr:hypothetical protein BO71DRAFT_355514 [Aspergillus ellipticus CBS 707.79]